MHIILDKYVWGVTVGNKVGQSSALPRRIIIQYNSTSYVYNQQDSLCLIYGIEPDQLDFMRRTIREMAEQRRGPGRPRTRNVEPDQETEDAGVPWQQMMLWCRFLYLPVSLGRTARYTLHAKFGRRMRPWWDEFCFSSSYDITRTFLFVLRVGKGKKRSQLNPRSLLSVGNSPRLEILESGGSVIHREVFKHPTYL